MNEAVCQALLDKSTRSLVASKSLLQEGNPDFAIARAYYAMFYAAEALLASKGLRYRKHGSVHAAFGEHFAKTGIVDQRFHRWLLDAFDQRILGDYGVEVTVTEEDAWQVIAHAEEFLAVVRNILGL